MSENEENVQNQDKPKQRGDVHDERIAPGSRQPQLEKKARRSDGSKAAGGKRAWSPRRKAAAVVAVVSVLLIGCSGLAIASSWNAGSQQEQAQQQEGQDGQGGSVAEAQGDSSNSGTSDDEGQTGEGSSSSSEGSPSDDGASNAQSVQENASTSSDSGQEEASTSGSSQDGSAASADANGGAGSSQDASGGAPTSNIIRVSVVVDSSAADGSVQVSQTVDLQPGASAYDALVAAAANAGVGVRAANTQYGVYVAGIGGVSEKQFGGGSGWLYAVNGATPGFAASAYELSDGDSVTWFYTRG